ncbi:sterol desaturase family protein [Pseudomonas sp. CAU 1711]|uniref:sterol desaturase family protein n=1 Tax=Pseudomonas sp. CAU 1711 TaxID=3140356 RepID=UPI003260CB81
MLRILYAPLFCFGLIGLATWLVGYRQLSPLWLLALLPVAILLSLLAERLAPYQPSWNRPHGDGPSDLLHALVNEALNLASLAAIPLLAGLLPTPALWPLHWPLWLQLLLAIAAADLGITLMHWLSHRSALLWRLHAVHHSAPRLYGFNGLMKHPLHQLLEASAGVLPLVLLGLPQDIAALLAFAIAVQLLLQHGNVDMRIGALRHLFAWAPLHRFHHLRYGRAGDVNFALFFSFWDRLLGTAFYRADYRLGDQDVGIGDRPNYPRDYLAQLLEPFRASAPSAVTPQTPAALRSIQQP